MTGAFIEREAGPVVYDAPCTVCGAEGGPVCDDCATICARAAEHTASALESERARSDAAERELVLARARAEELERDYATLRDAHVAQGERLANTEEELRMMKTSSQSWEKRANAAMSEVTRLLSRLGAETDVDVDVDATTR